MSYVICHMSEKHNQVSRMEYNCEHCDFQSPIKDNLIAHIIAIHVTQPKCVDCDKLDIELKQAKERVLEMEEMEENFETARQMFLKKKRDWQK